MGSPSTPSLSAVHALLRSERAAIAGGATRALGELARQTGAVLAIADGPSSLLESDRDPQVQGAIAALLGGRLRETLVLSWLAAGGPAFALAAAVHERRVVVAYPSKPGGGLDFSIRWIAPRTAEQTPLALDVPTWDELRTAFRRLKKADKPAAQDRARELRSNAPLALACWIDSIAGLPEEAAADARLLVDLEEAAWHELEPFVLGLLPALASSPSETTREAAQSIVERVASSSSCVNQIAPYAKEAVDLVGAPILPTMFGMLTNAHRSTVVEPAKVTKVAQAVARVEDPAVGKFFATYVTSRLFGTVATEYVVAHAETGTAPPPAALERAALMKSVKDTKARDRAKKTKAAAKKTKAASVIAASSPADASELPWVLREPPWREGSALPIVRAVTTLRPLEFSEKLHLSDTDREGVDDDDTTPVGLLVRRGLDAVEALARQKDDAAFYALRRVESPRVARAMTLALDGPRSKLAKQWLETYPEAVACGLLPLALGGAPAERALAMRGLRCLLRSGEASRVREVAARLGEEATAAMDDLVAAIELLDCPSEPPDLPGWANPTRLPRVALAGGRLLSEDAVRALLEMLAFTDAKPPYVGLEQARAACDPVLLDAFLIALVEAWLKAGTASDDWALRGAALLGGADAARAFAKWIKAWSRERSPAARARAVVLVEALGAGNDDAITVLAALPRKGVRGSVGEVAEEMLRDVARRKGLDEEDLADLVVPTLDLPPDGRVRLDFGTRAFEIRVDDALVPHVHDAEGRRITSALRALKTDDPTRSRASLDRMRSLKKGLAELARTLSARFDHAMTSGRRWRASVFASTIVQHPLLSRLARGLVWARADWRTGTTLSTFRVTEDGSFADARDEPVRFGERDAIVLPHPLEIDPAALDTWSAVFGDYQLVPPFPQLGRPLFDPTSAERQAGVLSRFRGEPTTQMAIAGRLEARGWRRLDPQDGFVAGYTKKLRTVTAHYALVDPIVFGEPFVNETSVGAVSFGVPLDQVPAVAFSEAAFDLSVFRDG
jgi:hypothetical protein